MTNSTSNSLPIYIYESSGTISSENVLLLKSSLKELEVSPSRTVTLQDVSYLKREISSSNRAVLIIPGGFTTFLCEELKSEIKRIREAVAGGWNYTGFCAGGNFASKELVLTREGQTFNFAAHHSFLNLLPVRAETPVYELSDKKYYNGGNNSKLVPIVVENGDDFPCFWNEGSSFHVFDNTASIRALAYYGDLIGFPIAAVSGSYGKGKVVASGIHPEIMVNRNLKVEMEFEGRYSHYNYFERKTDKADKTHRLFLERIFDFVEVLPAS